MLLIVSGYPLRSTIFKRSKFVLWLEQDDERHDVFLISNGSHSFLGTSNFNGTLQSKLSFPITAHPQEYESRDFFFFPCTSTYPTYSKYVCHQNIILNFSQIVRVPEKFLAFCFVVCTQPVPNSVHFFYRYVLSIIHTIGTKPKL